jgi:hypothetical protein
MDVDEIAQAMREYGSQVPVATEKSGNEQQNYLFY